MVGSCLLESFLERCYSKNMLAQSFSCTSGKISICFNNLYDFFRDSSVGNLSFLPLFHYYFNICSRGPHLFADLIFASFLSCCINKY